MDIITQYRPLAEFAYFLSWPLLIGGVIVGLFQIKEFKKEANTRFKRESILLSLEISERKLKAILALSLDFHNNYETHGPVMTHQCTPPSAFSKEDRENWSVWYEDDSNNNAVNLVVDLLNELEGFAQYIHSGVVDEELCYQLQWAPILYQIELVYNYMSFFQTEQEEHTFENVLKLYNSWSEKSKYDATIKAHKKLTNDLNSTIRPKSTLPIGA